ncbi:unnamed protein product [Blepharisma stoltei]|uniref:Uncharacterized protein n=1 Tax=Blepharisma stoltei TaxID=1481888 RepID=A0AAU9IMR9_9CILI|nr:unnamed protein product [Blepharisma stoltei]
MFYLTSTKPFGFETWSLSKQFAAAQYYLKNQRPTWLADSDYDELNSLNLKIAYGEWVPNKEKALENFAKGRKEKMKSQWQKLEGISKSHAMKRFLDKLKDIVPNWYYNQEILQQFNEDWNKFHQPDLNSRSAKADNLLCFSSHGSIESINLSRNNIKHIRRFSGSLTERAPSRSPSKEPIQTEKNSRILSSANTPIPNPKSAGRAHRRVSSEMELEKSQFQAEESKNQIFGRIKSLIKDIDQKSEKFYNFQQESLIDRLERNIADIVKDMIKPRLDLLSHAIGELEEALGSELTDKVKILFEIHRCYMSTMEAVFDYWNKITEKDDAIDAKFRSTEKSAHYLKLGMRAIKELNDPYNEKRKLYGVIRLSKEEYEKQLLNAKEILSLEDSETLFNLERIIRDFKDEILYLKEEIRQKDTEIEEVKKLMKNTEERTMNDGNLLGKKHRLLKKRLEFMSQNRVAQDYKFDKSKGDSLRSLQKLPTAPNIFHTVKTISQ